MGKDATGDAPLLTKIAAGLTTGALAITIASPTDLVKVRMQAEGKLPAGVAKRYPSALSAYSIIAKCAPAPSLPGPPQVQQESAKEMRPWCMRTSIL